MSMIKSPEQISLMREAGRVVANTLAAVREAAGVGVALQDLDSLAAETIAKAGATPAFLNYHPRWASVPFPGVICTSVNDAVVHGIPDGYQLKDGDLLSVDCVVRSWKAGGVTPPSASSSGRPTPWTRPS